MGRADKRHTEVQGLRRIATRVALPAIAAIIAGFMMMPALAAAAPPPPEVSINVTEAYPDGSPAVAQIAVTLTLRVPHPKDMRFSNDGGATWSAWEAHAQTKAWVLAAGDDGMRTVTGEFRDNFGVTHMASASTLLDTRAPWTGMVPEGDLSYYNSPVPLVFGDWSDPDPSSGLAAFQYRLPGENWQTVLAAVGVTTVWLDPALLPDGEQEVFFRALDGVGNAETAEGSTEPRSVLRLTDTIAPVTVDDHDDDAWHNVSFTVGLSADDGLSGVAATRHSLDGGLTWADRSTVEIEAAADHADDGVSEILYYSVDAAQPSGNEETAQSFFVKIDTAAPAVAIDDGASDLDAWQNQDVALSFSAEDEQLFTDEAEPVPNSGVDSIEYRVDGGDWTQGDALAIAAPADHSGDGIHAVEVRATDVAGNAGDIERVDVAIDTTPPTLTLPVTDWWSTTVPFEVAAEDELAGIAVFEYRVDEGEWTPYEEPFLISGEDGDAHTVEAWAEDAAGNTTSVELVTVTLDSVAAVTLVAGADEGWHTTPVTLSFTAEDERSGVAITEYSLDGGVTWTTGDSVALATSAIHTVLYRSLDLAGNVEETRTATVKVDLVGPRTAARAASGRVGVAVRLRYKGTDNLSHKLYSVRVVVKNSKHRVVKRIYLRTRTAGVWYRVKWKPAKKGIYRYYVYAKDAAGLKQSKIGSAKVVVR